MSRADPGFGRLRPMGERAIVGAMRQFEKLGAFYLGREIGAEEAERGDPLLYEARDLTTHAVVVGMTGSGKTGLCVSLLEEAALDGVPAIAIDPKGDIGNLLLTFPELRAEDFEPWIDEGEARRRQQSVAERAAEVAESWKTGLAAWEQGPERIARLRETVDLPIYTPGSSSGIGLSVLGSFEAPAGEAAQDADALRERLMGAVSGLLGLLGLDADPLQSADHIFLSTLLQDAWERGAAMGLAELIRAIQDPPIARVGVMDLDTFYPPKKRQELAMRINALLASPGFQPWLAGEKLDIERLLYTPAGKPRISIVSIAHLGDDERMFFVTLLLTELIAWMRRQPGTSSLRALLYMDEVFGFLPPVANPPSKTPMLTLLKQARAFGLGVVLATQNPVDVDYKALSNCGTWFLGRLQTERDVNRVIDGLSGAADAAGQAVDAASLRTTLARLQGRQFLMNNVHEPRPLLFQTRWALSYLRGPLTRAQIRSLMDQREDAKPAEPSPLGEASIVGAPAPATRAVATEQPFPIESAPSPATESPAFRVAQAAPEQAVATQAVAARQEAATAPPALSSDDDDASLVRPAVPEHLEEVFLGTPSGDFLYQPGMLATVRLRYVKAQAQLDAAFERSLLVPLEEPMASLWSGAHIVDPASLAVTLEPAPKACYLELPRGLTNKSKLRSIESALKTTLVAEHAMQIGYCAEHKLYSKAGESRMQFMARVQMASREARDEQIGKLEDRYGRRLAQVEERLRKAMSRVEKDRDDLGRAERERTMAILGAVGSLFGRRSTRRTFSAVERVGKEKEDLRRSEETVEAVRMDLQALQDEVAAAIAEVHARFDAPPAIEELAVRPRKQQIDVLRLCLAWVPIAR